MSTEIVQASQQTQAIDGHNGNGFSRDQVDVIKSQICKGASDTELQLFMATSQRLRLDPFARQIYAIKRWSKDGPTMQTMISIEGQRAVAHRTGQYNGEADPLYCGEDEQWKTIWNVKKDGFPLAVKFKVYRKGVEHPIHGLALWSEYAQKKKDGNLTAMWKDRPIGMLTKCAEALALRKAFPEDLSGVYVDAEMDKALADEQNRGEYIDVQAEGEVEAALLARMDEDPEIVELFDKLKAPKGKRLVTLKTYESDDDLKTALRSAIEKTEKAAAEKAATAEAAKAEAAKTAETEVAETKKEAEKESK
jgi:phage recombination protein Bet